MVCYVHQGVVVVGGIPYNGQNGGTFFKPQVYEGIGISVAEVYERIAKSVIVVCTRT